MFFINKITESYYNDYYKQIFRNILENTSENDKICIINLNYFNLFEHFSHFIKKFNIYFTIRARNHFIFHSIYEVVFHLQNKLRSLSI